MTEVNNNEKNKTLKTNEKNICEIFIKWFKIWINILINISKYSKHLKKTLSS
jgi:hypothetical protein